jgi:hypothetical protein
VRWILEPRRWERAILGVIAVIVAYQVFAEPIVGTADNSDYWRVMNQVGVGYQSDEAVTRFRNLQLDFDFVPRKEVKYLTSQVLLARVAVAIDRVVADHFDLRVMGFVNSAAYLAAIAVFLRAFRKRRTWQRVFVGVASAVIFTDVRIVAYFNSFYCEAAQVIFLVATIGFALLAADRERALRRRSLLYAGFLVSSVLFLFAKNQDLVFCFPLAVTAICIYPSDVPAWRARGMMAATIIALFVWGMKSDAYAITKSVNIGVTLEEEILAHSPNKDADLAELGDGQRSNVTFGRIATFYAHHPIRWWKCAKRRMQQAFTRTPYGNFERPRIGESTTFDTFSELKNRFYPRSLRVWVLALLLYAAMLFDRWRRGSRDNRTLVVINAMWVIGCILEFIAIVTFEANGTEKHFFIFNVLVDLVVVMSIFDIADVVSAWRARRAV